MILIYCIISIIYSSCDIGKSLIHKFRCVNRKNKDKKQKRNLNKAEEKKYIKIKKENIVQFFKIKSKLKFGIIVWLISFCSIINFPIQYKSNIFVRTFGITCFIIFLTGAGFYLNHRIKNLSLMDKFITYLQKLGIFVLYSSIFFIGFLTKLDSNSLFFLAIFMLLIYSICFLKYVLDDFKNFTFLLINLISIYIFDLIVFGYIFGVFYITRNDIYQLVSDSSSVLNEMTLYNNVIIINKGLYYFYNYCNLLEIKGDFNVCVPLFQYILGAIFNIAIIGVFISYTASRAFIEDNNKNENIDSFDKFFEEIKKRKFKITVKKDDLVDKIQ